MLQTCMAWWRVGMYVCLTTEAMHGRAFVGIVLTRQARAKGGAMGRAGLTQA